MQGIRSCKETFVARYRHDQLDEELASPEMNTIINAKRFDIYAAVITSGTIQMMMVAIETFGINYLVQSRASDVFHQVEQMRS